jgi:nicotinate-nucleotide pyrophosphorylase (carboxylating)
MLEAEEKPIPNSHSALSTQHSALSFQHSALSLEITEELESLLRLALQEDVGSGDVTSEATIPAAQMGEGFVFAKSQGVLCGVTVAERVMRLVDANTDMRVLAADGESLGKGMRIAELHGGLRSILTAERVMLNFLQRMSGIATLTRRYVDALREAGSAIQVVDTRKTTPVWRRLERHAVATGGGVNHRFALYDMYLIKNNHADAAGGVGEALRRVREHNQGRALRIAVEARNLDEVRAILKQGADLILLDNMAVPEIREAVALIAGRAQTEITGGVTLENVRDYAGLPVDRISVGALTHSAPALDIALHVEKTVLSSED